MAKFIELTDVEENNRLLLNVDLISEVEESKNVTFVSLSSYFIDSESKDLVVRTYAVCESYVEVCDKIYDACEVKVR